MKITKKDCESKQEINKQNYLTKKYRKKENMEERDIKICLKKKLKEYPKNREAKKSTKNLFSLHGIKMEQKVLFSDKKCINKNAFHKNKKRISIDKIEIRRIVLSEKESYGKKCTFKCYIRKINETDAFTVPLCITLRQINGYVKYFNDNKCVNLLVYDRELLRKYNEIWNRISNLLKKSVMMNQCIMVTTLKLK